MDTPVATFLDDTGNYRYRFAEAETGYEATAYWKVNTRDIVRAMGATGLPRIGDAFSAQLTNCTVIRREVTAWGGLDEAATGTGGWCIVQVDYQEPSIDVLPFKLGRLYTVIEVEDEIKTTREGRNVIGGEFGEPGANIIRISGGEGVPQLHGVTRAVVVQHKPHSFAVDYPRLISLASNHNLNDDELILPAPINSFWPFAMEIGQVRYDGFRISALPAGLIIEHELSLKESHFIKFYKTGPTGIPDQTPTYASIYERADMSGLW